MLFDEQEKVLNTIIKTQKNNKKSDETLISTILRTQRIALYKVLSKAVLREDVAQIVEQICENICLIKLRQKARFYGEKWS